MFKTYKLHFEKENISPEPCEKICENKLSMYIEKVKYIIPSDSVIFVILLC